MSWTDQKPEATDVLLTGRVCTPKGENVTFEIDRIEPDGPYRATVGNLFESREICRNVSLDKCLRWLSIEVNKH